jgi:hypothetical protein
MGAAEFYLMAARQNGDAEWMLGNSAILPAIYLTQDSSWMQHREKVQHGAT